MAVRNLNHLTGHDPITSVQSRHSALTVRTLRSAKERSGAYRIDRTTGPRSYRRPDREANRSSGILHPSGA